MTYTRYEQHHGQALLALSHLLNGPFPENRRAPFHWIEQVAPGGARELAGIEINWQALDNWSQSTSATRRDRCVVKMMHALAVDGLWPSLDTLAHYKIAHEAWFAVSTWHGCPSYWRDPTPLDRPIHGFVGLGELSAVPE